MKISYFKSVYLCIFFFFLFVDLYIKWLSNIKMKHVFYSIYQWLIRVVVSKFVLCLDWKIFTLWFHNTHMSFSRKCSNYNTTLGMLGNQNLYTYANEVLPQHANSLHTKSTQPALSWTICVIYFVFIPISLQCFFLRTYNQVLIFQGNLFITTITFISYCLVPLSDAKFNNFWESLSSLSTTIWMLKTFRSSLQSTLSSFMKSFRRLSSFFFM